MQLNAMAVVLGCCFLILNGRRKDILYGFSPSHPVSLGVCMSYKSWHIVFVLVNKGPNARLSEKTSSQITFARRKDTNVHLNIHHTYTLFNNEYAKHAISYDHSE